MGDTLNSLLAASRSSTVLQGIANPAQINPLAAMTSAAQTAGSIYGIRKLQAERRVGQIATQSIDPVTKQFDQSRFNAQIADAGPDVAMAAQPALQNASTLADTQTRQQLLKIGWYNGATGALPDNASRDDVVRTIQSGASVGMTPTEIQNSIDKVPTDPAGLTAYIQQHRLTAGDTAQRLQQSGGRLGMSPEDQNAIVQVPYPQFNPDGTPNPNWGRSYPMRKGDVVPLLTPGAPTVTTTPGALPPSLRNPANTNTAVPAVTPAPTVAPATTATPPNPAYTAGVGAVLNPGATAAPAIPVPPTPPATVPPPAANAAAAPVAAAKATGQPVPIPGAAGLFAYPDGTVGPPRGAPTTPATPAPYGPRAALQGGVPVASVNALQPNIGAPGPPSPAVPGDVAAIMAGMQRGSAPTAGTVAAAGPAVPPPPPQAAQAPAAAPAPSAATPAAVPPPPYFGTGPSQADLDQQKQGQAAFQNISDQAVPSRSRSAILGNMLGDTTQFTTGPLASRIETVRAVANRFGFPVSTEGLSAAESFNKLAAQLANAQGAGSDARLNVNVAANPHAELSPAGVDLMLRQLQGNEDYIQARAKLAMSYGDQTNVRKFESDVGAKVDPRAFQFARMTPPQRQAYTKGLSAADLSAVKSSYNWLYGQGLVGN